MNPYKHRQVGTVMIFALGIPMLAIIVALLSDPMPLFSCIIGFILTILTLSLLLFFSLTVEITHEVVRISFGFGLLRKDFKIPEIKNVQIVRNTWRHGWGIRFLPHGMLYTVSGFDAVEIEMRNNVTNRIGTNDPHGLFLAIQNSLHQSTAID